MRWKDLRRSSNVRDVRGAGGGRMPLPIGRGGSRRRARRHRDPRGRRSDLRRPGGRAAVARRRWRHARRPASRAGRSRRTTKRASSSRAMLGSTEDVWGALFAQRARLPTAAAHAVRRRRAVGVRFRELGVGPVLLPRRSARLSRHRVLRRARAHGRARRFRGRPTSSATRSAITCRTCSAPRIRCAPRSSARARPTRIACKSRWSCKPTASPASGPITPIERTSVLEPGDVEEGLAAAAGHRRRHAAAQRRPQRDARLVHARLCGGAAALALRRACVAGDPSACDTFK